MSKVVRLRPKNKKANYFMGSYTVMGKRLKSGKWYFLDDETAAYLKGVHSRPSSPGAADSIPCFDVCDSQAEAHEIVKKEKKAALRRSSSRRPGDLTTADLRGDGLREVFLDDDESSDEEEVDKVDYESPEDIQTRKQRSLRNAKRMDDKVADRRAAKAAEEKRLADEKSQALKELDAANDHEGEGAEEPESIDEGEFE